MPGWIRTSPNPTCSAQCTLVNGDVTWIKDHGISNPKVERCRDCLTRAELEQVVGRARLDRLSGRPRKVHIIAEAPLRTIRVDEVRSVDQVL